jgi:hypothetical protein
VAFGILSALILLCFHVLDILSVFLDYAVICNYKKVLHVFLISSKYCCIVSTIKEEWDVLEIMVWIILCVCT